MMKGKKIKLYKKYKVKRRILNYNKAIVNLKWYLYLDSNFILVNPV